MLGLTPNLWPTCCCIVTLSWAKLPLRSLTHQTPESCHYFRNHVTHLLWPHLLCQAAIASLIEVRISADLSDEGTSNCSKDTWSYDEIFTGKITFGIWKHTFSLSSCPGTAYAPKFTCAECTLHTHNHIHKHSGLSLCCGRHQSRILATSLPTSSAAWEEWRLKSSTTPSPPLGGRTTAVSGVGFVPAAPPPQTGRLDPPLWGWVQAVLMAIQFVTMQPKD